ncbi:MULTISPECIES: family 43 glycosylhydrolase [Vibrio]|uniref:Family 43 glycosylhydrolase n=2 Tax=Vibrio TaxID=662 RepID=A0A7X4LL73_9VIBR|nr:MULTISPECIES: family 43 glycosylhydrolase [Vibrio]MBF9002042.1 family 43 glycosylhydrolase [Vibrio nitrifigilis]MZI94020.1 family 43 glycosylhydrolase [Vibrio eleionomae]
MFDNLLFQSKWWRTILLSFAALLISGMGWAADTTFTNPVYENGADPWVMYYDGNYYSATTTWSSQLEMRKSATLAGLADATPVNVWSETNSDRCCNFWAFEFHRLKGPNGWRWYMLYTSGHEDTYDYQHLSVLESAGDDPMGPYQYKGSPMEDSYNIDGSYITINNQLYLMYSQWVGDEQKDFIIKMSNPWTTTGQASVLTHPTEDWEKVGMNVNEGPEGLIHDGRVFVVYSASYCATPDYKLGMLELTGDDPLDSDAWTKYDEPVFTKGNGVYGPGHNGFFTSPDGSEDWLVYHGNANADDGCGTGRALRAQSYTWNSDGTPNFGEPIASGEAVAVPSGENGPMRVKPQAPMMRLNHYVTTTVDGETQLSLSNTIPAILDSLSDGTVRFTDYAGGFLSGSSCSKSQSFLPWENEACQKWQVEQLSDGLLKFVNSDDESSYMACDGDDCDEWGLSPLSSVAVVSAQSGLVVTATDTGIEQQGWSGDSTQIWWMQPEQDGTVTIVPDSEPTHCLNASDNNATFGTCSSDASHWYLRPRDEGGYRIVNKSTGRLLDLTDCALDSGTVIGTYDDLDNICQRFYLRNTD